MLASPCRATGRQAPLEWHENSLLLANIGRLMRIGKISSIAFSAMLSISVKAQTPPPVLQDGRFVCGKGYVTGIANGGQIEDSTHGIGAWFSVKLDEMTNAASYPTDYAFIDTADNRVIALSLESDNNLAKEVFYRKLTTLSVAYGSRIPVRVMSTKTHAPDRCGGPANQLEIELCASRSCSSSQ